MLNRQIGFVVRGFDLGGQRRGFCGLVVKEGVGQRATDALLEQDEQGGDFDALGGEPIRVGPTLALKKAVGAQLAHVIPELGERIRSRRDPIGFAHRGMQRGGAPAGEL